MKVLYSMPTHWGCVLSYITPWSCHTICLPTNYHTDLKVYTRLWCENINKSHSSGCKWGQSLASRNKTMDWLKMVTGLCMTALYPGFSRQTNREEPVYKASESIVTISTALKINSCHFNFTPMTLYSLQKKIVSRTLLETSWKANTSIYNDCIKFQRQKWKQNRLRLS